MVLDPGAADYIKILEKTVNSLRTQVNTMNFKNKSELFTKQLKPLTFYQKQKPAKIKAIKAHKKEKTKEVDWAEQFEKQLSLLSEEDLSKLWSAPTIIDITSHNKFFESSQKVLK